MRQRVYARRRRAADLRQAALDAAGRGWPVFPLVPASKRPAIQNWNDRASTDPERIGRCWTPSGKNHGQWNIGVACGPANLVVVDLDVPKPGEDIPTEYEHTQVRSGREVMADLEGVHGDLPDTYTVTTQRGGKHLYYTAEADLGLRNTVGDLGWLIDTRGPGGYAVAAGSRTRTGGYVADDPDAVAAELPEWVRDQLTPRETEFALGLPEDETRRAAYVEAAVRNELGKILHAAPHTRNNSLFVGSASLGRLAATGQVDISAIRGALVAAGEAVGQDPKEARATVDSGLRNGGIDTTPRVAPRSKERVAREAADEDAADSPASAAESEPTEEPSPKAPPGPTDHPQATTDHRDPKVDPESAVELPPDRVRPADPIERARQAMAAIPPRPSDPTAPPPPGPAPAMHQVDGGVR